MELEVVHVHHGLRGKDADDDAGMWLIPVKNLRFPAGSIMGM